MGRVAVFQFNETEAPGRLGRVLDEHGFELEFHWPNQDSRWHGGGDASLDLDVDNVSGVVVLPGEPNVDQSPVWLEAVAAVVRTAHEQHVPVVGICTGMQVITHALGGAVKQMDTPECGLAPIELTPAAADDPVLAGVGPHPQFHGHTRMMAALPPDAELLASSAMCPYQAYRVGRATYGFQFHFELETETELESESLGRGKGEGEGKAGVWGPVAFAEYATEMFGRAGITVSQVREQAAELGGLHAEAMRAAGEQHRGIDEALTRAWCLW